MLMRNLSKTLVLLSLSGAAFAGPAADNANQHFKAIAAGDVDGVMRAYGNDAQLQWVGGPLDGVYRGDAKIKETWAKFSQAQGKLQLAVSKLEESANPKGATVTANVEFTGKAPIKVRYVLTYRDNKLVSEVWQIDPNLAASPAGTGH